MELKKLGGLLSGQLVLLQELLTLLERETGELGDIRLEAMMEINRRKEELSERIEAQASQLRGAIAESVATEGLPAGTSLGALADKLKQKGNREIPQLHGELNRVVERIRQALAINREIAERFANSVSTSLGLLTRLINQSSMYGASGGYQQRSTGAVMINREA